MLKIAIIILNWNGLHDTLACLASLEKLTYPHFEVIIVDNGSTDDSVSTLRHQFPQHLLIATGSNLGFSEGNNAGIREALDRGADLVFLLNNDTVVASDILEAFLDTFQKHPETGILGAKIFRFDKPDTFDHLGGTWDPKTGTFQFAGHGHKEDGKQWQEPQELDYVCGAGMIITRACLSAVGYLEPRFFLIWEESDFCFRARKSGFKTLTCPHAKLWHKVSASFVGGKPHSTYFWWRNRLLWIERNCSVKEKWRLSLCVLIPDILHMIKIRLIKKMQIYLTQRLRPQVNTEEKENKLMKNRAALCGVRDYCLRRFGNGPAWLFKK